MKFKIVFTFIAACLFSLSAWSDTSLLKGQSILNEESILNNLSLFEKAVQENDTVFFQKNLDDSARMTIHSKQRNDKYVVEFSKQEVVDGKLHEESDLLNVLERVKFDIQYYNNNTQALLTYTMRPKKESKFREEKGYSVETEMMFQVVKNEIKIMNIVAHIDLEPNYQAQPAKLNQ